MCKFFKHYETKSIKTGGALLSLLPLATAIVFYGQGRNDLALANIGWFIGSLASFGTGYMLRDLKKCNLPHIADNVQIQYQREGEPDINARNYGM